MTMQTVQDELLGLEKEFWRALKDKDIDAALRLTNDPCIVAGAQGVASIDKPTFAKMMQSATWTLHDFDVEDAQVRLLSDDVAILAYRVREKLTVDGKPVSLDAADTSTWVRRDGHWLCASHTESIAGDPYGRDRRAATG
jgi:ketosteroid isomerase-like protein